MPGPSETGTPGNGNGNGGGDGDGPNGGGNDGGNGGSGNGNGGGNGDGNGNGGGNGNGDGGNGTGGDNGDGGGDGDSDGGGGIGSNDSTINKTTAIAVGVTLGILALLAVGIGTALYVRRQRREQRYAGQFRQIDDHDPDAPNGENPHFTGAHSIPAAHPYGKKTLNQHNNRGLLGAFGLGALALGHKGGRAPERKDMLADEDTRNFGGGAGPYKQSSTGSTWSLFSAFGGRRSREPSMGGSPWLEKGDPFSDGSALLRDEQTGFVGAAAPTAVAAAAIVRPRGAPRQASYASSRSGTSYRDPFSDPNPQEYHNIGQSDSEDEDVGRQSMGMRRHPSYSDHPPPAISTMFPLGTERHLLSPLSEATSRHSLSDPSNTSQSSHEHGSTRTSMTSYDHVPSPKHNSFFDGQPIPAGRGVARSDTWWNRFSKTSFLDRRGSTSSRHSNAAALDFRDPNPPPVRLSAIEEKSAHSQSPESMMRKTPPSATSSIRRKHSLYASVVHQKSTSSVKTADTAAIERMGGMDVVRLGSGSRHTRSSVRSSFDGLSILEHPVEGSQIPIPVVASPVDALEGHDHMIPLAAIPSSSTSHERRSIPHDSSSPSQGTRTTPTKRMSALVSSRVGELQSRMEQEQQVLSPTNTRSREERVHKGGNRKSMSYGVVPRASLFVANPEG